MKRRDFISNLTLAFISAQIIPNFLFGQKRMRITDDELMGRASLDFVNPEVKLRTEAYESYLNMKEAAIKDGIEIGIVSAFRSFEDQSRIWKRKYNQYTSQGLSPEQSVRKIIEYSTIPGT
ncbi:MAG: D-alanyl-D-alanine carboxypeptidase family protein, partial [Flavobacteriaceae bacterium]|nr:D-alanyl-D-alanine carboxypeptidase family protein [Flavobacteriaceae bacterium]